MVILALLIKFQMKERRKQQLLKRKNFLPALVLTVLLWSLLFLLVYFVDPGTFGMIFVFFVLFFTAILFTFSLIFAGTRQGLIGSIALTIFAVLLYLGVGNWLNFILIVAIGVCIELYFGHT